MIHFMGKHCLQIVPQGGRQSCWKELAKTEHGIFHTGGSRVKQIIAICLIENDAQQAWLAPFSLKVQKMVWSFGVVNAPCWSSFTLTAQSTNVCFSWAQVSFLQAPYQICLLGKKITSFLKCDKLLPTLSAPLQGPIKLCIRHWPFLNPTSEIGGKIIDMLHSEISLTLGTLLSKDKEFIPPRYSKPSFQSRHFALPKMWSWHLTNMYASLWVLMLLKYVDKKFTLTLRWPVSTYGVPISG